MSDKEFREPVEEDQDIDREIKLIKVEPMTYERCFQTMLDRFYQNNGMWSKEDLKGQA